MNWLILKSCWINGLVYLYKNFYREVALIPSIGKNLRALCEIRLILSKTFQMVNHIELAFCDGVVFIWTPNVFFKNESFVGRSQTSPLNVALDVQLKVTKRGFTIFLAFKNWSSNKRSWVSYRLHSKISLPLKNFLFFITFCNSFDGYYDWTF